MVNRTSPIRIAPRGSELSPLTPPKTPISESERTREDTVDVEKPPAGPVEPRPEQPIQDPDLAKVVKAWPELPEHVRQAILALVRSAAEPEQEQ